MRKQKQTIPGATGNCVAACVASIMDIDLAGVPNFSEDGAEFSFLRLKLWLQDTDWCVDPCQKRTEIMEANPEAFFVVFGPSPRSSNWKHTVVYKGREPFWDPHADDRFLADGVIEGFWHLRKKTEKSLLGETVTGLLFEKQ